MIAQVDRSLKMFEGATMVNNFNKSLVVGGEMHQKWLETLVFIGTYVHELDMSTKATL